ncbi:hypothetical protein ACFL35_21925, partial [Candidatus Riflebacteria bacterium]
MNTGMVAFWFTELLLAKNLLFWPLLLVSILIFTICLDLYIKVSNEKKLWDIFQDDFTQCFQEQNKDKLVGCCNEHPCLLSQ